jgi:hypothetical protein
MFGRRFCTPLPQPATNASTRTAQLSPGKVPRGNASSKEVDAEMKRTIMYKSLPRRATSLCMRSSDGIVLSNVIPIQYAIPSC